MPQVIDVSGRGVRRGGGPGGCPTQEVRIAAAGAVSVLVPGAVRAGQRQRALQAQAHGEIHHVLPGRRVVLRIPVLLVRTAGAVGDEGRQQVVERGPQVGGPVVERDVGQTVRVRVAVDRSQRAGDRVVGAVGQLAGRAVGVAAIGAAAEVAVGFIPHPVGHQDVGVGTAGDFGARGDLGILGVGRVPEVDRRARAVVLPRPLHRRPQGRAAVGRQTEQPLVEVGLVRRVVGAHQAVHVAAHARAVARRRRAGGHEGGVAGVERLPGHPCAFGHGLEGLGS